MIDCDLIPTWLPKLNLFLIEWNMTLSKSKSLLIQWKNLFILTIGQCKRRLHLRKLRRAFLRVSSPLEERQLDAHRFWSFEFRRFDRQLTCLRHRVQIFQHAMFRVELAHREDGRCSRHPWRHPAG